MITEQFTIALNGVAPDVVVHPYLLENSEEIEPNRKRPLVLVLPGGGYSFRSFREAEPVAVRMLGLGYSCLVVDYAVHPHLFPAAMLQVMAVIHHARQHAEAWHIDRTRIVLMGFSAGGHLAASVGVLWMRPHYAGKLGLQVEDVRPNALALGYPVITTGRYTHEGSFDNLLDTNAYLFAGTMSLETQVCRQTPPTFLWHTRDDDTVPVENSLLFADALREHEVPHALTIFPKGIHGISLSNREVFGPERFSEIQPEVARWPELFDSWYRAL